MGTHHPAGGGVEGACQTAAVDPHPAPVHRPRAAPAALALALVALVGAVLGACGVEVPDDVAADIERSTTTTTEVPTTTAVPTSDDELEQALIDNGYTLEEARCGAENLRDRLSDAEVREVIEADTIEDIGFSTANDFADALRPCVEGGAAGDDGDDGPGDGDGDDEDGGRPPTAGPGPGGRMPDIGDDSEVDVSRSRFLAALLAAGVEGEVARCFVDGVFAELDQDEINDLFHADSDDEVPADVQGLVMDLLDDCEA